MTLRVRDAAFDNLWQRRDEYNRLVGRKTLLKGYVYDRRPLHDGDAVASGERLEVVAPRR